MEYRSKRIYRTITILMLLIFTTSGFGQKTSINQNRLNRDLRIMEGVLSKLLRGKTSHRYINGKTKAVYLPGFGIVFHTSQEGPAYHNLNAALRLQTETVQAMAQKVRDQHDEVRKEMEERREEIQETAESRLREQMEAEIAAEEEVKEEGDVVRDFLEGDSEKIIEEEKKAIESLKENIIVFFRNYTSAVGQLQSQDRFAVLINLNDWRLTDSETNFLTGWVTKQDVDRYRQNRLKESDFMKSIHFQLASSDSDVDMDINILSEIFDRAMDRSTWWGRSSNNGIYIGGLGALLFMDLPSNLFVMNADGENLISVIVPGKNYKNAITTYRADKEKEGKSQEERIQKVQDELFELMASYGHTVRIKPQESIVLNVNLGSRTLFTTLSGGSSKLPSRLILQLKKKDLDEYNRGFITIDALKKKLLRQTY